MKRFILSIVMMLTVAMPTMAMSYEQARERALFLTDKMAYELNELHPLRLAVQHILLGCLLLSSVDMGQRSMEIQHICKISTPHIFLFRQTGILRFLLRWPQLAHERRTQLVSWTHFRTKTWRKPLRNERQI